MESGKSKDPQASSNRLTNNRRRKSYLSNPKKYFYPMNISPTNDAIFALRPKKSTEKIPDFLRDILLYPPEKPRALSQVRLQINQEYQRSDTFQRSTISKPTFFASSKAPAVRECKSQDRVLYKPTVFLINPRSKVTLYTMSNMRCGSAGKIISADPNDKKGHFRFKSRAKKLRFLIPEFCKTNL